MVESIADDREDSVTFPLRFFEQSLKVFRPRRVEKGRLNTSDGDFLLISWVSLGQLVQTQSHLALAVGRSVLVHQTTGSGLIDSLGSLHDALDALHKMISRKKRPQNTQKG